MSNPLHQMIAPSRGSRKGQETAYDGRMTKSPKTIKFGEFVPNNRPPLTDSLGNFTTKPNFGQGRAVVTGDKAYS
jgi:hypothetical protein